MGFFLSGLSFRYLTIIKILFLVIFSFLLNSCFCQEDQDISENRENNQREEDPVTILAIFFYFTYFVIAAAKLMMFLYPLDISIDNLPDMSEILHKVNVPNIPSTTELGASRTLVESSKCDLAEALKSPCTHDLLVSYYPEGTRDIGSLIRSPNLPNTPTFVIHNVIEEQLRLDPNLALDCKQIFIDPTVSKVVRQIFSNAMQGNFNEDSIKYLTEDQQEIYTYLWHILEFIPPK